MNVKTIALVVVLIGLAIGTVGAYKYADSLFAKASSLFGQTTGATFLSPTYAGIYMAPSTGTATTSSIVNNSGASRLVTGLVVACSGVGTSKTAYTGAGLAALTLTVGTSSAAAPATFSPNLPIANAETIATSSAFYTQASTTPALAVVANGLWQNGEYMTFSFNATNTAACGVGVDYVAI